MIIYKKNFYYYILKIFGSNPKILEYLINNQADLLGSLHCAIKANNIDEGAKAKDRATKCKMFERKYEEHFEPEIFKQVY